MAVWFIGFRRDLGVRRRGGMIVRAPRRPSAPLASSGTGGSDNVSVTTLYYKVTYFFVGPYCLAYVTTVILNVVNLYRPNGGALTAIKLVLNNMNVVTRFVMSLILSVFANNLSFLFWGGLWGVGGAL